MNWWITNASRTNAEKSDLARLFERADWLAGVNWRFGENLQLIVDFDVIHNGETFPLYMVYPSTFPDSPPMVIPHNGAQLSGHQYGNGGELCLEFRPDNWDSSITGAMMADSAYRLLSSERPPGGEQGAVRSAHEASVGRDSRSARLRFLLDSELLGAFATLPVNVPVPIKAWDYCNESTCTAALTSVSGDSLTWVSPSPSPSSSIARDGFVLRTEREIDRFLTDPQLFLQLVQDEFPEISAQFSQEFFTGFLLLGNWHHWVVLYLLPYQGKQSAVVYKTILAPNPDGRLPECYAHLSEKRVGIVGCGSVGSKVAATLARSGVRNFILVDEDLFFGANLARNDLDARAIGQHKTNALAVRIKDIVGDADITCRRIALGGQESAGATEIVMEELGQANLLIDATADPRAFNLVSAVARRKSIPLVWCGVFAGGIGGIVARARPGNEPVPNIARDQIHAWCDAQGVPWETEAEERYGVQWGDGPPLVADDADVSVISGHASRFCLDILGREESIFPHSAYAIGLMAGWIFRAPYEACPIELRQEGEWGECQDEASEQQLREFLSSMCPAQERDSG